MKTYTAKSPHKRACDLCDAPVLVGDSVTTWPWVNHEEGSGSGRMGNIMRVHSTCYAIEERHPRELFSPGGWSEELDDEAAAALAESRK